MKLSEAEPSISTSFKSLSTPLPFHFFCSRSFSNLASSAMRSSIAFTSRISFCFCFSFCSLSSGGSTLRLDLFGGFLSWYTFGVIPSYGLIGSSRFFF